jgi:tetratricopeptide (TPR) repeat protein
MADLLSYFVFALPVTSLELCNKHLGGTTHPRQLAETLTSLGMAYFKSGNFDDALSHLLSAHKIPLQWSAECCVSIRCFIGHVYYSKGDLDRAIPYYEDALNHASITIDHYVTKGMLDLFTVIGSCLWEQGNCDDAVSYISEAIQIREELISLGEFSEDDGSSRSTAAHHLTDLDMTLEMMEWYPVSAAA